AMKERRIRRASLRGWWRGLPLVLPPFAVLFAFAWFEVKRLDNEFMAGALADKIQPVNERNEHLEQEINELSTVDRLSAKASVLDLHKPSPGQHIVIHPSAETLARLEMPRPAARADRPPTRIVIVRLEPGSPAEPSPPGVDERLASRR